jgi:F-type H+-transporting ATPase subunit b
MDYFFAEPKNWILIGLALFFAVVFYAGAHTIIFKSLDDRAAAIRDELGRAAALRHEAEELLRQYAARKNAAEADAARIVAQAQADADSIRREAERELAADLQRRERQMEERIARAERLAADEVRSVAADAAIAAAETLLRGADAAEAHRRLVRQGAAEIAERFT